MKRFEPLEAIRIWAIVQIATRGKNAGQAGIVMTEPGNDRRPPHTLTIALGRFIVAGRGRFELVKFVPAGLGAPDAIPPVGTP